MRILGIDTSLTATGLARLDLYTTPIVYDDETHLVTFDADVITVSAPKPTKDKSKRAMVRRVNALIEQIEWCFKDDEPDQVAIESLAYGARGEGAWVLPWIFGRTLELCERYDVPLTVVSTSGRAKFAAGKGNAPKDAVLLAAGRLFHGKVALTDNNEADAMIVAAVLAQKLELPILPVTQYRMDVVAGLGD
jgi:Holliday junction resolvasome RuvABC endonuclease subunit